MATTPSTKHETNQVHVLCLHGCCQDVSIFRSIMKDYIKIGSKQGLVFHFLEAMYKDPSKGKTWYSRPLEVEKIGSIPYEPELVATAMDQLAKAIKETGATVLLGFSQGGNVVDTFLHHYHHDGPIERAVLCSTYPLVSWFTEKSKKPDESKESKEAEESEEPDPYDKREPLALPVLSIVSSEGDTITPPATQPTAYHPLTVIHHTKGHKMVTSKPVIRKICSFLAGASDSSEK